jgi:ABC transport system ATP-binding/permease protein
MTSSLARLQILSESGDDQRQIPLHPHSVTLGRGYDNHLVINETFVSRYHARIDRGEHGYTITDLGSANGTKVNDQNIMPQVPLPLSDGDRIEIGGLKVSFLINEATAVRNDSNAQRTVIAPTDMGSMLKLGVPPETLSLRGRDSFTMGRDPKNDLAIPHPIVSRFHVRINRRDGAFIITDLNSSNGTFVNGKTVNGSVALRPNDTIQVGPCSLVLNLNETLTQNFEEGNLRLDGLRLGKVVGKNVNLLNDISLSILPREFVALLGSSGSGKSTLLDALNGLRPATSGQVLVNGMDLYKNFQVFATQMGYVPQQNIIHADLTVEQAMSFAAQMRMPSDTTPAERQQRIHEVLDDIGLSHRRKVQIKLLSGGQQRRVSIGVELLNKPSLFFLDEATSGLDPGTEADMMVLLRQLADQGRTILLITHATQNIRQCDLVLYLAEGGRMAYFGPPDKILEYFRHYFPRECEGFGLDDFSGIYRFLDPEKNPQAPSAERLEQQFRDSPLYQQYVVERQREVLPNAEERSAKVSRRTGGKAKVQNRISGWRQFRILSSRNLAVLAKDKATLALMFAIAPLLGMLDFITWKSDLFSVQNGSATQSTTMLFVSALIAVMIGEITTMNELVKEDEIYRRERLYGLKVVPYILSKVWIAFLFSVYQGAAYLLVKMIAVQFPGGWDVLFHFYLDFTIAIMAGAMLGLLVSAIAPNQSMSPLLMIMILVPQIIFSGGIQPASNFGPPGQLLNRVNVIKWPFELLVTHSGLGQDVAKDPCLQKTDDEREKLTAAELDQCQCIGPNVFKGCRFPGILTKYVPEIDQPEPLQPKLPAKPPSTASPEAQLAYQKEAKAFQVNIKTWQTDYQTWRQKRQKAISEAEGVITKTYDELGYLFNIKPLSHFVTQGLLILSILIALPFVQKRKDAV